MNAREHMQALMDGKTIGFVGEAMYKMDKHGHILSYRNKEWEFWNWGVPLNDSRMKIMDEYNLTFKEALKELLDGHTVTNNVCKDCRYSFDEYGNLLCIHNDVCCYADITDEENTAQWKVVN